MQKVTSAGTIGDVIDKMENGMEPFEYHMYTKKVQQSYFSECKSIQRDGCVTLVVDYSENYSAKTQHEIQSGYFDRRQISLFTAVAYIGPKGHESFLLASDDIAYNKDQVYCYLKIIFNFITKKNGPISEVKIFSDGAAS